MDLHAAATTFERRRFRRRRVFFAARIGTQDGGDGHDCVIRGISESGALLRVDGAAPVCFALTTERDGVVKMVRTVWRVGETRGVSFAHVNSPQSQISRASVQALRCSLQYIVAE